MTEWSGHEQFLPT